MKKLEMWKAEMPTEQEMLPKDKYTVFDRKVKRYRKGIHSKWNHALWLELGGDGSVYITGVGIRSGVTEAPRRAA